MTDGRLEPGDLVEFYLQGVYHKGVVLRHIGDEPTALVGYPWRRWNVGTFHIEISVANLSYTQDEYPEGMSR